MSVGETEFYAMVKGEGQRQGQKEADRTKKPELDDVFCFHLLVSFPLFCVLLVIVSSFLFRFVFSTEGVAIVIHPADDMNPNPSLSPSSKEETKGSQKGAEQAV